MEYFWSLGMRTNTFIQLQHISTQKYWIGNVMPNMSNIQYAIKSLQWVFDIYLTDINCFQSIWNLVSVNYEVEIWLSAMLQLSSIQFWYCHFSGFTNETKNNMYLSQKWLGNHASLAWTNWIGRWCRFASSQLKWTASQVSICHLYHAGHDFVRFDALLPFFWSEIDSNWFTSIRTKFNIRRFSQCAYEIMDVTLETTHHSHALIC